MPAYGAAAGQLGDAKRPHDGTDLRIRRRCRRRGAVSSVPEHQKAAPALACQVRRACAPGRAHLDDAVGVRGVFGHGGRGGNGVQGRFTLSGQGSVAVAFDVAIEGGALVLVGGDSIGGDVAGRNHEDRGLRTSKREDTSSRGRQATPGSKRKTRRERNRGVFRPADPPTPDVVAAKVRVSSCSAYDAEEPSPAVQAAPSLDDPEYLVAPWTLGRRWPRRRQRPVHSQTFRVAEKAVVYLFAGKRSTCAMPNVTSGLRQPADCAHLLDVGAVGEEHDESIDTHTPASCRRQCMLEGVHLRGATSAGRLTGSGATRTKVSSIPCASSSPADACLACSSKRSRWSKGSLSSVRSGQRRGTRMLRRRTRVRVADLFEGDKGLEALAQTGP